MRGDGVPSFLSMMMPRHCHSFFLFCTFFLPSLHHPSIHSTHQSPLTHLQQNNVEDALVALSIDANLAGGFQSSLIASHQFILFSCSKSYFSFLEHEVGRIGDAGQPRLLSLAAGISAIIIIPADGSLYCSTAAPTEEPPGRQSRVFLCHRNR